MRIDPLSFACVIFLLLSVNSEKFVPFSPEDVGLGHTRIVRSLKHRLLQNSPDSMEDYLYEAAVVISENLCDEYDVICRSRIMNKTFLVPNMDEREKRQPLDRIIGQFPGKMLDPFVYESLEKLFFSVSLVEVDNYPKHVLQMMWNNFEELKNSNYVTSEFDRHIGIIAYSVALESLKEWSDILLNNSENPFHRMKFVKEHRRKLQTMGIDAAFSEEDFEDILEADIIGGAEGAITKFFTGQDSSETMVGAALEGATVASLQAVVGIVVPFPIGGTEGSTGGTGTSGSGCSFSPTVCEMLGMGSAAVSAITPMLYGQGGSGGSGSGSSLSSYLTMIPNSSNGPATSTTPNGSVQNGPSGAGVSNTPVGGAPPGETSGGGSSPTQGAGGGEGTVSGGSSPYVPPVSNPSGSTYGSGEMSLVESINNNFVLSNIQNNTSVTQGLEIAQNVATNTFGSGDVDLSNLDISTSVSSATATFCAMRPTSWACQNGNN